MNYETIKGYAEDSFIERKSEFIGYIKPVATNDEAVAFIEEIRAKHRKATHNVYAYILRDGNISRYSDDGEPQGTAGVPVYAYMQEHKLLVTFKEILILTSCPNGRKIVIIDSEAFQV